MALLYSPISYLITMSSVQAYQTNKLYFGSFWGLYMIGIKSIFDLKYSIGQLAFSLVIELLITFYANQIIFEKNITSDRLITLILVYCISKIFRPIISYLFEKQVMKERLVISQRIDTYVNHLYINAPYAWKLDNPNASQKESLRDIFFAYDHMTSMITYAIESTIDAFIVIVIAFTVNISIGFVIIVGTFILFKLRTLFNKEAEQQDKQMGKKMNEVHITSSNQFTNRIDIIYTPTYSTLFSQDKYDPVIGLINICQVWDNRNILSKYSRSAIDVIQSAIVLFFSIYLWYSSQMDIIIFVVVNNNRLFGFLNVMSHLEEVKNVSGSRLSTSFTMIDELCSNLNLEHEPLSICI